jgi:hypothetical protein
MMLDSLGYRIVLIETDTNYTLNTLRKMEIFITKARDNSLLLSNMALYLEHAEMMGEANRAESK